MKLLNKIFFSIFLLFPFAVSASLSEWKFDLMKSANYGKNAYNGAMDDKGLTISAYVGQLISILAPVLIIIFFGIVIYSGFEWMTASGNMDKVETAQKRIKYAAIGMFLFAILYVIAYFIISRFGQITGYNI